MQLSEEQRLYLADLLRRGEPIPPEYQPLLFPAERREYELVYAGKERREDVLANTLAVPLQDVRSFGGNGVGWKNKLIFGDNLQTLAELLRQKRAGELCNADGTPGVRLIYIDPPFATKQEFEGSREQKAYQDKIVRAAFLEALGKRLVFLRELLSDDGSLYIHLDWKKVHYIKVIADELFGERNFRNEIVWHYPGREMHTSTKYNAKHDMILFYAKSERTKIKMSDVALPYDRMERLKGLRRKIHTDPDGQEWVWETRGQAAGQEPYKRYVDEIISQGKPLNDV